MARTSPATSTTAPRPRAVFLGRWRSGNSNCRPRVYAASPPTNATPAGCGEVRSTSASVDRPRIAASADSNSWIGIRRVASVLSDDHKPQRDAVGRPTQQPPKKHPSRPIASPNRSPGAVASRAFPPELHAGKQRAEDERSDGADHETLKAHPGAEPVAHVAAEQCPVVNLRAEQSHQAAHPKARTPQRAAASDEPQPADGEPIPSCRAGADTSLGRAGTGDTPRRRPPPNSVAILDVESLLITRLPTICRRGLMTDSMLQGPSFFSSRGRYSLPGAQA